ncbi:hypothetical protein H1R20_g12241, partial [Candolleomyces eurysporus]
MNSTLREPTDYHSSSGMSELDSLSDSDWLDIASGHDSDNASLSDESEGEGEPVSQPLSRTSSSISLGSSRGEVEAWEGFVDEHTGEVAARLAPGMYPMPPTVAAGAERIPLGLIPDIVTDQDIAEDELVKEALNQSLIGTLNASRTSTTSSSSSGHFGSNQASVRDLRLSFPDPLTSQRSELERSYEEVSADDHEDPSADTTIATDAAVPADLGLTPAPLSSDNHEVQPGKVDFEIYLYGASTKYKWVVVQDFLHKVADGSGQFLINTLDPINEKDQVNVQTAILGRLETESKPFFNVVRIFDRTESDVPRHVTVDPVDAPSLGIVFLPANRLPVLGHHTTYFAVLARDDFADVLYNTDNAARNAAEDDWELLNIPPPQVLKLKTPANSTIINHEDIKLLNARQVHRSMQSILYEDDYVEKESGLKGQMQVNPYKVYVLSFFPNIPVYGLTLLLSLTVVSVLLGIALNASSFRSPAPTPTVNMATPNNNWTTFTSLPNHSTSVIVRGTGKTQVVASSARDTAVSIYNAGTTALSVTSQAKALVPTAPQMSPIRKDTKAAVLSDKPITKEVIVPSASTSLSEVLTTSSIPTVAPQASKPTSEPSAAQSEPSSTAVGLNFVNSLSEVLGVTTQSIVKAVNEDGAELMEGLDELMTVIRTQTDDLIKQSKGKARALGDQVQAFGETIQARNDKARSRAKELKRKGEELIMSASEHVKERTNVAKKRARRIRESVEETEAWKLYQRAHDDWSSRLEDKENWPNRRSVRRRSCLKARDVRRGRRDDRFMGSSIPGCV